MQKCVKYGKKMEEDFQEGSIILQLIKQTEDMGTIQMSLKNQSVAGCGGAHL